MSLKRIEFFLSERAADPGHTNPNLSLGGAINATEIASQTVVFDNAGIAGVTLVRGAGNADGVGTVEFIFSGTTLRWTPPGGTTATNQEEVDVSVDGTYVLTSRDGNDHLTVTVVAASLPVADTSDTVTITGVQHNLFSTISKDDSLVGLTKYRCLFLKSIHTVNTQVKVWVNPNYAAVGALRIGGSKTLSGSGEPEITDELTAPLGVTFGDHVDLASARTVSVDLAESIGLWLEINVAALNTISSNKQHAAIQLQVLDV